MARDDDLLDDVMTKLTAALGEVDVDQLRDAVRKGLDQALHALDPHPDEAPADEAPGDDDPGENVVVLEPRGEPPPSPPRIAVRVTPQSLDEGRVWVRSDVQTVWSGERVVPYRLVCDEGHLGVAVDDRTVAQLGPGQTADVEGRAIRVSGEGRGRYRRLG